MAKDAKSKRHLEGSCSNLLFPYASLFGCQKRLLMPLVAAKTQGVELGSSSDEKCQATLPADIMGPWAHDWKDPSVCAELMEVAHQSITTATHALPCFAMLCHAVPCCACSISTSKAAPESLQVRASGFNLQSLREPSPSP